MFLNDIFFLNTLKGFLCIKDFNDVIDISNKHIRFLYKIYNLNNDYSLKYLIDKNFKKNIDKKTFNNKKQIILNLNLFYDEENDDINKISNFNDSNQLKYFENEKLSISTNLNIYFEQFQNIKYLQIHNCNELKILPKFLNLKELKIINCINLHDISNIENINKILLSYCDNIRNIESLKNVEEALISNCENINSIKDLKNCKDILLYRIFIDDTLKLNKNLKISLTNCYFNEINNLYDNKIIISDTLNLNLLYNFHGSFISENLLKI